jgi:vancomycin permeability regulator SanA
MIVAIGGFAACVYLIQQAGKGRVYDRVDSLPARDVGLVLGTGGMAGIILTSSTASRPRRNYITWGR